MMKSFMSLARIVLIPLLVIGVVLWFFTAVADVDSEKRLEDKRNLEEALRRATVLCYAVEGAYPPDVEYLVENYDVQIDGDRFAVKLEYYGSNLMPDITVLERAR